MKFISYFFPKRSLRERLPLPPRQYTSEQTPYPIPPERLDDCRLLIAAGVARTTADAYRLIVKYPTMTYRQIIRKTKRKRHPRPRWLTFLIRLKKLLIGMVAIVALLSAPFAAAAQEPPLGKATIIAGALNVRAEPSPSSEKLGHLRRGAVVTVYEVRDGWLRLRCQDKPCWINGSRKYVRLDFDVETKQPDTIAAPPLPDVTLSSYTISPAVPRPDQAFTITLVLANIGAADASAFSIAAALPDGKFAFHTLNGIPAGGQGTIEIATKQSATGRHELAIALDIEDQLEESNKVNNLVAISYMIDQPFVAQSAIRVDQFTNVDLHGGTPDLSWDGKTLTSQHNAQVMLLSDVRLTDIHFDMLEIRGNSVSLLQEGMLIGVITSEGRRGWLRVASVSPLEIQYAIYANK